MPPRRRQRALGDSPPRSGHDASISAKGPAYSLARGDSVSHPRSSPRPRHTAMARPHTSVIAPTCSSPPLPHLHEMKSLLSPADRYGSVSRRRTPAVRKTVHGAQGKRERLSVSGVVRRAQAVPAAAAYRVGGPCYVFSCHRRLVEGAPQCTTFAI